MGKKRKTASIPKVYDPKLKLIDEDEFLVKKKVKSAPISKEELAQAKESVKTVRPDVRAYYPIYSDTKGAWQADLMFIPYTNKSSETRLHALLCLVNINTKWAFVRQCNFNATKTKDSEFQPKGPNEKVSVGTGGDVYGVKIAGNAKSAANTRTKR